MVEVLSLRDYKPGLVATALSSHLVEEEELFEQFVGRATQVFQVLSLVDGLGSFQFLLGS